MEKIHGIINYLKSPWGFIFIHNVQFNREL